MSISSLIASRPIIALSDDEEEAGFVEVECEEGDEESDDGDAEEEMEMLQRAPLVVTDDEEEMKTLQRAPFVVTDDEEEMKTLQPLVVTQDTRSLKRACLNQASEEDALQVRRRAPKRRKICEESDEEDESSALVKHKCAAL